MEKSENQVQSDVLIKLANQTDLTGTRLDQVLSNITETVARTLDLDQVSIWQIDQMNLDTRCISVHSRVVSQKPLQNIDLKPCTTYLLLLQTEQAFETSDTTTDTRVSGLTEDFWMTTGIQTSLNIPIRISGRAAGILRLDTRRKRDWTRDTIQFCTRVGDLVAQVILSNDLKMRNQQIDILKNVSTEITHRFNLNTFLNDLICKAVEIVHGSYGMIFMTNAERREVVCAVSNNTPVDMTNQTIHYGEDVAGKVAETGQALLIRDYRNWPGRSGAARTDEPLMTILSVPLTTRSVITGVLQVTRRDIDRPFTNDDRDILFQIANLASLAIEQNQLTEVNNRMTLFQQTLNQIIETTTFASSATDFIETTVDYLLHALSAPMAVIQTDDISAIRSFALDANKQIESTLQKRGRRFNLTIVVHDLTTNDAGFTDMAETLKHLQTRAYILAPVLINRERTGFICVASPTARNWTQEEIAMVEITAHQTGLAIEGIRFYQETQSQIDMVKRLSSVTTTLNRLASMDEMIPMIGQGAVRMLASDCLAVLLREEDGQIHDSFVFGLPKPDFSQVIAEEGETLVNIFLADTSPTLISNIARSSLPPQTKKYLTYEGIKTVKMTPITHSKNVIGVIMGFYENVVDWPQREREMMVSFANTASLALQNVTMYEQLEKGYMDLALTLASAMDARDSGIKTISLRIADWAQRTAQLLGCTVEEQNAIRWAALLHDIGKAEVPDEVLNKPGPLSKEEWNVIHHYPVKSEKLLEPLSRYQNVGEILRNVRERYDGKGYPDKRGGEDIPLGARILAVADAYGSMIDNRPYREAKNHDQAVNEIMKNSGVQFDPAVVNAFLQTVSVKDRMN